jgi:hypothetical protein
MFVCGTSGVANELFSYSEARSNVSALPNVQPAGGWRRLSWFSAIVGPSPGWVDRRQEEEQTARR